MTAPTGNPDSDEYESELEDVVTRAIVAGTSLDDIEDGLHEMLIGVYMRRVMLMKLAEAREGAAVH